MVRREQNALAHMSTEQLKYIAATDFVPKGLRGNMPAILACVATGRELGLADMESLRSIHIIDGKATMSAELMVKLVRRRGHSISGSFGDGQVTVTGRRADTDDEMAVTWTRDMATRAGLVTKDNWKRYPEAMLWARAASQLCRMLFPDCLGGVSYTEDEAELTVEERVSERIGAARPPQHDGPDDRLALEQAVDDEPALDVEPEAEPESPAFVAPSDVAESEEVQAAVAAAQYVIPNGQHRGLVLADLQDKGERGESWLRWALTNVHEPVEYRDAVWAFARVYFPDLFDEAAARSNP